MTKQRRITIAVLGSALVAFTRCGSGSGSIPETPEGACRRVLNYMEHCLIGASGTGFGVSVSQLCEGTIAPTAGEMSAVADCFTSFSCAEWTGDEPLDFTTSTDCVDVLGLLEEIEQNAPEGLEPSAPASGSSSCQPLTGYEFCLLSGTCPEDCSE